MSTTDTGPEEPRRQRAGLFDGLPFRRRQGRSPGLGRGSGAALRGQVPPTDTREARRLLAQAESAGRRAADDGTLNPYVLGSTNRLPYFGRLTGLRGHARDRIVAQYHDREEQELLASAELYAETAARESEARQARDAQDEETRRRQAAAARLDRAATRIAAREDRRDRLLPWAAGRFGAGRADGRDPDSAYQDDDHEGTVADWDDDSDQEGTPAPKPSNVPWEGLRESASMARGPRLALALLLILVELPVYVTLFLAIHDGTPEGRVSAYLLSAAVGVVMTAGPFQAGRQWRRRAATVSLRVVLPVAFLLACLWAWAAWYLGDLRARIVFRDTSTPGLQGIADSLGVELPPAPTLLEQLQLDSRTVGVTFISLLLLSGGIAFLLALSEEHPFIAAYRHHHKRLTAAEVTLARAQAAAAAAQRQQGTLQERRNERGQALTAELAAVDSVFEAAAHAYLDGVQAASHDPAVTEGAMRLSARYPLLPEPLPSPSAAVL
ncbi:hypothetical protein OG742_17895 [Streptomyces sp. NBC_00828]|uniref:hypothetical protein n=1 Tax=Streptomyces sp. NBC_00828 TaxID=2903678 RepID=UPI00386BABFC